MSFPNLMFTDEGKSLQLKAMNGDSITFTKVEIGNGEEPENISKLTQLNNRLYVCGITNFETNDGYATIHWSLDSMAVTSEFNWTEYGIYAKDSFNNEILYAYAYDSVPQIIPSADSSSITQIEADLNIAIGNAENVDAIIGEYSAYASKEVVNEHINNIENPHNVTKSQIGLGNVDNVSTNNASPTFTASTALSEINSGETATNLWGKVKTAIKAFIDHKNDKNNPHGITIGKIGAAATSHTHSTTDINDGILPQSRGGTGVSNLSSLFTSTLASLKANIKLANARYLQGTMPDGTTASVAGIGSDGAQYVGNDSIKEIHIHSGGNQCFRIKVGSYYYYLSFNTSGNLYTWKKQISTDTNSAIEASLGTSSRRFGTIYAKNALNTSDRKNKENITDAEIGLEILKRLSYKEFNFIDDKELRCGLIAQDVFKLFQELGIHNSSVYSAAVKDNDPDKHPELENLTDEQILKHDDKQLVWSLDYQTISNYCIAGFQKYMLTTEQRLNKLENTIGGM